jgi:hypothetical protein
MLTFDADTDNKRCVCARVREGGKVLQTIDIDLGCLPAYSGVDRRTLFLVATRVRGTEHMAEEPRTGRC